MATESRLEHPVRLDGPYAWYVLGVLCLVYALNFLDRQIVSILAEDIKHKLTLSDAQLGYLYGTAFALFYALFGIPLGRLADRWNRIRLLSLGLIAWSVMTMACGLAASFAQLALFRIGVGAGEAAASPAAYSLIGDYFSARQRALAISIYAASLYLGMGLSLPLGGWLSTTWDQLYAHGGAPLALLGWQAAFLAIGLPGLAIAAWVWTLREPFRAGAAVRSAARRPGAGVPESPWRILADELAAIVPPFTLWTIARSGAGVARNALVLAMIAGVSAILILITGDAAQWACFALGVYAVFSWSQVLRVRDRPAYALIWGTPGVVLAICAFGSLSFFTYAYNFWSSPYAIRSFHAAPELVGTAIGLPAAFASALGVLIGGRLSDLWKARDPRGRIFVAMLGSVLPLPCFVAMFVVERFVAYCVLAACVSLFNGLWLGSAIAAYQDFVLPRMRGTIGAIYLLGSTMIGLALGPYFTGKIATLSGSLRAGAMSLTAIVPISMLLLWLVAKRVEVLERTRAARATAAGEGR